MIPFREGSGRVIEDTLEMIYETWEDPGDYPNGVAAGPLEPFEYFAGIDGHLVLWLSDAECAQYSRDGYDFADEIARESMRLFDLPPDFEWHFALENNVLTCEPT